MEITKDKEYTTKDGREVRIYATDGKGEHPIHGAYKKNGEWIQDDWTKKGQYLLSEKSALDLIEKPKTKKVWIDVYIEPMSEKLVADVFDSLDKLKQSYEGAEETKQLEVIEREYPIK